MSENKTGWQKPNRCGSGASDCVEVLLGDTQVFVRDSKNPEGPELTFSHEEWRAFTASAADGQYSV